MKAIYNLNREVLAIGENIADGNTWCEITSANIPKMHELIKWGCLVYKVDVNGVLTKRTDEQIKESQPLSFNNYQSMMRAGEYVKRCDWRENKAKRIRREGHGGDADILEAEASIEAAKIKAEYPYVE